MTLVARVLAIVGILSLIGAAAFHVFSTTTQAEVVSHNTETAGQTLLYRATYQFSVKGQPYEGRSLVALSTPPQPVHGPMSVRYLSLAPWICAENRITAIYFLPILCGAGLAILLALRAVVLRLDGVAKRARIIE